MIRSVRMLSKGSLGRNLRLMTLTLGFVFMVVACGGQETVPAMPASSTAEAESVATTPPPPASGTTDAEGIAPDSTNENTILHVSRGPEHHGAGTPSVEARIYDSDVVVRASLQSSGNGFLGFRAIEYLKGTGPADITVHASTSNRNTAWDDREAVLFLNRPEDPAAVGVVGTTGEIVAGDFVFTEDTVFTDPIYEGRNTSPVGYTIDSRDPAWLPAGPGGGDGDDAPVFITDEEADVGDPPAVISLESLRSKIAWVDGGEDTEGYDRCIILMLDHKRWYRDWEAYYGTPWTPYQSEARVTSGAGEGAAIYVSGPHYEPGYHKFWLTGQDAALFKTQIVDDDEVPSNGYSPTAMTARPLPGSVYRFFTHFQRYEYQACNFMPDGDLLEWVVTVAAPDSAVHEAFFDPVAIDGAVGADGANGVLNPASFSLTRGGAASLGRVVWESGQATLELEPSPSLAGHHADFIALDGSVSLRLDFDDAAETVDGAKRTLAWNVCTQPWRSGDLLMLRVSRSGEGLTGATNDGPCNRPPQFDPSSYTFSVPENAASAAVVGRVSAADPDEGDAVSYSIASGNKDGKFAIGTSTGEITVVGTLDYETAASYTLTVGAGDGNGGTATAAVEISVTDVGEDPPP